MRQQLKSLSKQTLIYGGGLLLKRGIGFLMIPIYTRLLNPQDYGLLEILDLTGYVAAFFVGFGILQAVYRFHADTKEPAARRRLETNGILTVAILGGTITAALVLVAPWISELVVGKKDLGPLVVLLFSGVFVNELGQLILGYFRVENRPYAYVGYSLASTALTLTMNIVFLVVFGMGVRGILLSTLISGAVMIGFLIVGRIPGGGWTVDRALIRGMLAYSIPFIPTWLMAFTVNFSDRYFLRVFTDMTTVGVYALGYKMGMIVGFLVGAPFGLVWKAQAFEISKTDNAAATYGRIMTYYSAGLLAVCALVSVFSKELVTVMAAPSYAAAAAVIPPIAWSTVFLTVIDVVQIGILVKKRTIWLPVIYAGTTVINVVLNLLMIPSLGMMGAVWATVAALGFQVVAAYVVSQRLYPITYEWRRLAILVTSALVVTILGAVAPALPLAQSLALKSLLLLAAGAALLAMPGLLLPEERALLAGLPSRLRRDSGGI